MQCKKAKKMEAEKMALNLSNIPIVIFIKIQGQEVQVKSGPKLSKIQPLLDQSPLPSPRTTKTEANGDTPATRTSVSVANNLRFSSELTFFEIFAIVFLGTHAAWPAAVLNSQVYQLHNQNFHLAGAAGHKDLKELAIFTGQQNESQVKSWYFFLPRIHGQYQVSRGRPRHTAGYIFTNKLFDYN